MKIRLFLSPFLGGVFLFVVSVFLNFVPYCPTLFTHTELCLSTSIVVGLIISLVFIFKKTNTFKDDLLKTTAFFMSFFLISNMSRFFNIVYYIAQYLQISENEANGRAAGIGIFYFLFVVFVFCIFVILIRVLIRTIRGRLIEVRSNGE